MSGTEAKDVSSLMSKISAEYGLIRLHIIKDCLIAKTSLSYVQPVQNELMKDVVSILEPCSGRRCVEITRNLEF